MFIALRPLKVAGRTIQPGEPVPEAEKWAESVRRAHLNMEWIGNFEEADIKPPLDDKKSEAQTLPTKKSAKKVAASKSN